jgi:hypothetical protein
VPYEVGQLASIKADQNITANDNIVARANAIVEAAFERTLVAA